MTAPERRAPGTEARPHPASEHSAAGTSHLGVAESSKRLGRYLRARREVLRPADVGLRTIGRRRVPGLRREEVAELAGISREYYLRLEQGRGQVPSASVLGALAAALRLDEVGTAHLHTLASPLARAATADPMEKVPRSVQQLLEAWTDVPAYVQNAAADVLVANSVATELSRLFTPGTNLLRAGFLGCGAPATLPLNMDEVLARGAAGLRVDAGPDAGAGSPRLRALIDELLQGSEKFRGLWERYDVSAAHRGRTVFDHPVVGRLELNYTWLTVPGAAGLSVVAHVAEPGSTSAQALIRLATGPEF